MKPYIFIFIALLLNLNVFSQNENQKTTIADDLDLMKISDHAYIHISYTTLEPYGRISANGLVFISGNQAFLFDSPWTNLQTEKLVSFLKDSLHIQIKGFVPNHWHEDCMGGLSYILQQKIPTYANQMTIDIAQSNNLPVPEIGFTDSLELRLNNKIVICYYLGGAHSKDNIVVWIPSEKMLFPACMVKTMGARYLGNTADGDVLAYPTTLNKLYQKFPYAQIVIPGHGNYGGSELIHHTMELANKMNE